MKINWGYGITIAMLSYIAWMMYFLIRANLNQPSLSSLDAYQDGLNYQEVINRTSAKQPVFIIENQTGNKILLHSDTKSNQIKGNIRFLRPSDPAFDFTVPLKIDSTGNQIISTEGKMAGFWRVNMIYQMDTAHYIQNLSCYF